MRRFCKSVFLMFYFSPIGYVVQYHVVGQKIDGHGFRVFIKFEKL